ncbi:hypothetical protein [Thermus sp.]|uniref:hypothetical protein n=1 Tax=Thermus sp. TaxID=275 RepID=UPI00298F1BB1|nr:hypothetical protein [Thermus sp.]
MGKTLPIRVANVGSGEAGRLDFNRENLWRRMDGAMGKKAVETPVFLANPGQMDYLYPPKQLRFLDPDAVRRWARGRRERGEEDEGREPLQGLEPLPLERYRKTVAVGLYVPHLDDQAKKEVLRLAQGTPEEEALKDHEGPAIFLCPERILDWADREGMEASLVLDKVYYHELGHALMDTGPTPYGELWGRILEESLANWVAFRLFQGREARLVQRLIQGQPAEYWGYLAVGEGILAPELGDGDGWIHHWERRLRMWDPWEWKEAWYAWREWWLGLLREGYRFLPEGGYAFMLFPLFPLLGLPPAWNPEEGARFNFRQWRKAKRQQAFRDPEVVRIYAGFAEALLLRAVE